MEYFPDGFELRLILPDVELKGTGWDAAVVESHDGELSGLIVTIVVTGVAHAVYIWDK